MNQLCLRNRQKHRLVNLRLLRRILETALEDVLEVDRYQLAVHLVGSRTSACLNRVFLGHEGPTDVITFDHREGGADLYGEIFICVEESVQQAARFRTTWASELVRYAVHGMLHVLGYDDKETGGRRKMKRLENRVLRRLTLLFPLSQLGTRRV
jgi:probable rRNA maturation factor